MKLYRLTAISVLSMAVAACSTTQRDPAACALAGAIVGAGGSAAAASRIDNNWGDVEDAAAVGAIGAVAGGIIGYSVCALMGSEAPPPPPPVAKPVPTVAPVPVADPCKDAVTLKGVNFDVNKADVRPSAATVLANLASALTRCPQSVVYVEAHTDSTGSSEYNQALSQRRALSVQAYLIGRGVPADMLEAKGYGESQPIESNQTEVGRAQNRRVVLRPVE